MLLNRLFLASKLIASDINEHLDTLLKYGNECQHITEFGVRDATGSTIAFLNTSKYIEVVSYDIKEHENIYGLQELCKIENKFWEFNLASSLEVEIENTDFLFIDSLHTYNQLTQELKLHHSKIRKYIGFHDTYSFADRDEIGNGFGLLQAIGEFLNTNRNWKTDYHTINNNGLTILKRV